ncbi:MAG: alpha/beta hydrolase [Bacteroidota bacterium]
MQRHFIQVEGKDIHLRLSGKGFPLVMFHASPSSSHMFEALAGELQEHFTLIMPDTPGYGLSDPMSTHIEKIVDYIPTFRKLFSQLGLKQFAIYGSATGAQLGIRYALSYPEQVKHLFLDNAAHFTDEQYKSIKDKYFPDLTPVYDGSHLSRMWTFVRDMFRYFPWFMRMEANKLSVPELPAIFYHSSAMDFLQAGKNYSLAYLAAFNHEHAKNVQGLRVKTSIFKHAASIILPYIKQLTAHSFSETLVQIIDTPAAAVDRYTAMRQHMIGALPIELNQHPLNIENAIPSRQKIFELEGKSLHAFVDIKGEGMPLALVAAPGESATVWESAMDTLMEGRPGIILSLPGQGDSDEWEEELGEEEEEVLVAELMRKLGCPSFELRQIPTNIPRIKIDPPDAQGIYMKKAWIELREEYDVPAERLQLILRERLKYRGD